MACIPQTNSSTGLHGIREVWCVSYFLLLLNAMPGMNRDNHSNETFLLLMTSIIPMT